MPTFTGYEPNNLVGKGPGHTTQTTGSASSSSAAQQLVPADTLGDDFDRLFDESMSELFDEPLVPISNILEVPIAGHTPSALVSGPKGLAHATTEDADEHARAAAAPATQTPSTREAPRARGGAGCGALSRGGRAATRR